MDRHRQRGFTLIELLTVIAIISLLAGLLTVTVTQVRKRSAISFTKTELQRLGAALDAYAGEYGDYPPTSMEDFYGVSGNRILSGSESLLAHITRDSNFTGFEFKDEQLSNKDGDELVSEELLAGLKWVFVDTQLREFTDYWETPVIYINARDYGRGPWNIIHKEGKPGRAEAVRSSVRGWQQPDRYQLWSAGPDRTNENGAGDDVTIW